MDMSGLQAEWFRDDFTVVLIPARIFCAWGPPCSVCIVRRELNAGIWDQLKIMNISR